MGVSLDHGFSHYHAIHKCVAGARLAPPPPAAIGPGAGSAIIRLLPIAGDALLDPFEARNTDLNLRLAVRVETDAVAPAPIVRAEDILLWVGTGGLAATGAGGGCSVVDFVLNSSTGDWAYGRAPLPNVTGTSNMVVIRKFQPARSGAGGEAGFELSVNMSLKRSADGW